VTVDESRERLADKVLGRLGPGGLIQAPSTARVLESALLLALLTRESLPGQEEARRFLKTALDTAEVDELQQAFAHAALGEVVDGEAMMRRALASFRHFSSSRKLVTFQVLLAELGAAEMPRDVPEFDIANQQAWLRMQLTAVNALIGRDADWAVLEPALRPGPPWQGNHLARLMALFALRRRVDVREPQLGIEQLPGGGLPFVTGLDVFATAIAGIALARIRPDDPRLATMADALAARQQPDGGFGFTTGVTQTDVDDTAYTIEFLRATNRHPDTVAAAE
jgi:squalene-hopene/tetraprenyl-beta-curcumene cyclase